MNRWIIGLAYGLATTWGLQAANTRASLLLPVETVQPGTTFPAGILLAMKPDWHTYWRNPGASGMATEVDWSLPEGITAGEIQWPVPERYEAEGLITYVLHDEAMLLVPLTLASNVQPGTVTLKAEVSWLECEVLCVPGSAEVSATLVIGSETRTSKDAVQIARAKSRLPMDGSDLGVRAVWDGPGTGDTRPLLIHWPLGKVVAAPDFFPYAAEGYEVQPETEHPPTDERDVLLRKQVRKFSGQWPTSLSGVLKADTFNELLAYEVTLRPDATAEALPLDVEPATASTDSSAARFAPAGSLWLNLLLALGGGLILNLMPCVLPILSLKVLSLIRQGGASPAERRKHGFVYTLGVLVSFWAIGGLVIAGRLASWGEQFQDPRFIIIVTVLMTLVALNLFGVFEVVLPGSAVTSATELASKEGAGGAFFNGILAVVLGASCVAPMLAAAIGWAISQPPLVILLIFSMIGLGLALPFLVLSFFPALQTFLPKPGAWMERFKVAMGFPMLATAIWLLSQTADHFGGRGPLWVGLFLVMFALALWIYGTFIQRDGKRKGLAWILVLLFAGMGYGYALERQLDWRKPPTEPTGAAQDSSPAMPEGLDWRPWSTAAVAQAQREGRPVLVDFTANWCLTCNTIVKPALERDSVKEKLAAINAVTLLGDFTRKDPEIAAELKRHARAGVPLVLVYPGSPASKPIVLPDPNPVLGPAHFAKLVLEALDKVVE